MDRSALLVAFLATKGIDVDPDRLGNQKVSCFMHDDRNPSASVNMELGLYHCFSCDTSGDVYALIRIDRGVNFVEAQRIAESLASAGSGAISQPGRARRFLPGNERTAGRGDSTWVPSWRRRRPNTRP